MTEELQILKAILASVQNLNLCLENLQAEFHEYKQCHQIITTPYKCHETKEQVPNKENVDSSRFRWTGSGIPKFIVEPKLEQLPDLSKNSNPFSHGIVLLKNNPSEFLGLWDQILAEIKREDNANVDLIIRNIINIDQMIRGP